MNQTPDDLYLVKWKWMCVVQTLHRVGSNPGRDTFDLSKSLKR